MNDESIQSLLRGVHKSAGSLPSAAVLFDNTPPVKCGRRRLWQMTGGWHCAILGTCLALSDLRALGRKVDMKLNPDFPADYQLHGYFAKAAGQPGRAAKMLNKLLDRKYASAIRKCRGLKTEAELKAHWDDALDAGDIPGPYWAILSHPEADIDLCERMFADVHMLSHLVGASNRADIGRLRHLEEHAAALNEKLVRQRQRHQERLQAKDHEIGELEARLQDLTEQQAFATCVPERETDDRAISTIDNLERAVDRYRDRTIEAEAVIRQQRQKIDELELLAEALREETAALEQALPNRESNAQTKSSLDLQGHCLLYVGGRQQVVNRLRTLVAAWNGQLLHHDGGIEKSMSELASVIVRSDAVVFPTDRVSHDAMHTVKRLCRQTMKPYVPLRTSGVASFVSGLRVGLAALLATPHVD